MPLKQLTKNQHDQAAQLLTDYWSERGMPEYDLKWAKEYLIEGHKKDIKNDEFFVYQENGEIIGVVSLITDVSNVAEIRDMVIKPEFRRKGYGKNIVQELLELAKERKLRKVFGLVMPELEKFFEKLGFEKEGVLKNHFKQDEHLVVLSWFT